MVNTIKNIVQLIMCVLSPMNVYCYIIKFIKSIFFLGKTALKFVPTKDHSFCSDSSSAIDNGK